MTGRDHCLGAPAGVEADCGKAGPHLEHPIGEAAPEPCRYRRLVETLAAIDGTDLPDDIPGCDQPAAHTTVMVRVRDGVDAEVYAKTCTSHDALFQVAPGYLRSVKLRRP